MDSIMNLASLPDLVPLLHSPHFLRVLYSLVNCLAVIGKTSTCFGDLISRGGVLKLCHHMHMF